MLVATIRAGRVEVEGPIPEEWEGLAVQLQPLTPDSPIEDLQERLRILRELGPAEYEPGEREQISAALAEMDHWSREQMNGLGASQP